MLIGLFGISNDGLNLAVNLLVLFLAVVYVALIVWTFLDARRRIEDNVLVACATAAAFFPFVGPVIYAILRPPEFLDDRKERELEIRAAELRVRQLTEQSCPKCQFPIERTYLRCPNCQSRLKDPCPTCRKPVDPRWAMCPYCESQLRAAAVPPDERRRTTRSPGSVSRRSRSDQAAASRRPQRSERSSSRSERSERSERAQRSSRQSGNARPATPPKRSSSGTSRQTRGAPAADGGGRESEPRPAEAEQPTVRGTRRDS